jgi:hypothetical protein
MAPENILTDAKNLYLNQMLGVLSTHSVDVPGFPFGSIVPFCTDQMLQPVILISRLAQHTKNIQANNRVSLFVSNADQVGNDDVQTCSRLTVLARAELIDDRDAISRYNRYYPDAASFHQNLDFDYYRLIPEKVRFIGGFGAIYWVDNAELFGQNPFSDDQEKDIIAHMNADHADTFDRFCEIIHLSVPRELAPEMVGVDASGFHLRIGRKLAHIVFPRAVSRPMDVRDALVALLNG